MTYLFLAMLALILTHWSAYRLGRHTGYLKGWWDRDSGGAHNLKLHPNRVLRSWRDRE